MMTLGLTGFSQIENEISIDSLSVDEEMITYIETHPKFTEEKILYGVSLKIILILRF